MIWEAAAGPVTLQFRACINGPWKCGRYKRWRSAWIDQSCRLPDQFSRLHGYLPHPNLTCSMIYRSKASGFSAYKTCRESYHVLRSIFSKPVEPVEGLPRWFRFNVDTVEIDESALPVLAKYPWFSQIRHLYVTIREMPNWRWSEDVRRRALTRYPTYISTVEEHLPLLKDVTFDVARVYKAVDGPSRAKDFYWMVAWSSIFERWHGAGSPASPPAFHARVIRPHRAAVEWLTPTNFLCLLKQFLVENIGVAVNGSMRLKVIMEAPDEHLERPADFLTRNRHQWQG